MVNEEKMESKVIPKLWTWITKKNVINLREIVKSRKRADLGSKLTFLFDFINLMY